MNAPLGRIRYQIPALILRELGRVLIVASTLILWRPGDDGGSNPLDPGA